jgi:gas vesicle structural protein
MPVERAAGGTSLIDVLDRILDKGIVIDAWIRVSLVGIDLITVEARVVVASIDTYLRYAEALGITSTVARPAAGPGATGGAVGAGGMSGTPASTPAGAAERR